MISNVMEMNVESASDDK